MYTLIIRPLITQCIPTIDCHALNKNNKITNDTKKFLKIALKTLMVHAKQTALKRQWNTISDHMDQRSILNFSFNIKLSRRSLSLQNKGKTQKPQTKAMSPTGCLAIARIYMSSVT